MELRFIRGIMQLQSGSQGSQNGETRPDMEYGILPLKQIVKSIFKDIGYQCELLLYELTRERPRKKPRNRYNKEGSISPNYVKPLCLFSSYDGESIVRESVYHYLRQLEMAGFDTVFISTSSSISELDLKKLAGYCIRVINRENRGYDFFSWKVGLEQYPQYRHHAGLLLANDSVHGPFFDFGDIINRLENNGANIVGMTNSCRYYPHLQSYFLYCKSPVVLSKEFTDFFGHLKVIQLKSAVVRKYEVGFSQMLGKKFQLAALYPLEDILKQTGHLGYYEPDVDPTNTLWKVLVAELKFPFLKRSLYAKRGVSTEEIEEVITKGGGTFSTETFLQVKVEPSFGVQLSLSIAMTTYNGDRYLAEQLDSILRQSRLPDELVIHDDASDDTTVSVIRDFVMRAPFPVRLRVNCERMGSTRNFEAAIRECSGEIIFLCDQDDIWNSNKIALIEECFMRDATAGAVFSDAKVFHENKEIPESTLWKSIRFSHRERTQIAADEAATVLLRHPVVTGATMAFRSSLREFVLPIPSIWIHDAWISLLIGSTSRLTMISEPLISYRQHDKNQIGIRRHKRKNNKSFTKAYGEKALCFELARARLLEFADSFPIAEQQIFRFDEKLIFLYVRANLPIPLWDRWPCAMRELVMLRYHHYGMGFESFLDDVTRFTSINNRMKS
jgi:glycosyltransferase involved in cell wall biosynthesis